MKLNFATNLYIENMKQTFTTNHNDVLVVNVNFLNWTTQLIENVIELGLRTHDEESEFLKFLELNLPKAHPINFENYMIQYHEPKLKRARAGYEHEWT